MRPPMLLPVLALCACASPDPEFVVAQGALGPYSSGVAVGDLVLLSGKIGSERDGTFAAEAGSCIDAIERDLGALGLGLSDVVEARVYLTDMDRYGELNEVYGARFSAPYPARTCVAVKALPAGARVEIQVAAKR